MGEGACDERAPRPFSRNREPSLPPTVFLVAQIVKNLPTMWETQVHSLGGEDPLEEDMASHSSILAWRISMDRGAWWAPSMGSQSQTGPSDSHFHFSLLQTASAWQRSP